MFELSFEAQTRVAPWPGPSTAMSEVPKNISSWKLNKAEQTELQTRKESGECETTVKREIQTRKALANEARKKSVAAVASKCQQKLRLRESKQQKLVERPRAPAMQQTKAITALSKRTW